MPVTSTSQLDTSYQQIKPIYADKVRLRQTVLELNAEIGLEYDPTATAEDARRSILADGVSPEDNLFSCGIIAARNEE